MMVSGSNSTYRLNQELTEKSGLISLVERDDIETLLNDFEFDWSTSSCNPKSEIFRIFQANGWIDANGCVTRLGKLVYGRIALHFDDFDSSPDINVGNYRIFSRLRSGKNSVIFSAEHKVLGFKVVLKFIRPGASDDIENSLKKLASGHFDSTIVMPSDILHLAVRDRTRRVVDVTCLVFPFVTGQRFDDFLNERNNHLNSHVVISFIKQVGGALEELERIDAYHGDLHAHNILVERALGGLLEFKLLDISYDAVGSLSLEQSRNGDLENFKQHIWRILSSQKRSVPNVSSRKFLGTNYFDKVSLILSDRTTSFKEAMQVFRDETRNIRFLDAQARFINEKFAAPNSFRLQRYEEFTDPSIAARLFVPFPELEEKISEFGNVYVSGNRGSGKSTYLASLAFFPSVDDPTNKFMETFGVYFPCRQGEFRALTPVGGTDGAKVDRKLLHILAIKVVRRTLETIAEGISKKRLIKAADYNPLKTFLDRFVPPPGIILIENEILSEIDNFVATVVRVELEEIRNLVLHKQHEDHLIDANDLIRFFEIIRWTFSELKNTRFHLLFDDVGEPYVQRSVHRAINELLISSNPIYCVKLSAEKSTYLFETSQGKILENGHDYIERDISYTLFIGSGTSGIKREKLEEYFRRIVELRLRYFEYRTCDIRHYLGDQPEGEERLALLLALGRKDAYYCGWTTVWNIADRNPRNLLELVSEIFAVGNIERDTNPTQVPLRDQSRAIKTTSEKRLQSLSQIAGSFLLNGTKVSLGRKLFEVTATIGAVFYKYLKQEVRDRKPVRIGGKEKIGRPVAHGHFGQRRRVFEQQRVRQHLAIERNELIELGPEAEFILQKLVTFGVLDSSKSSYSRDDQVKKPIYVLNRIYCPAFSIGYRRDDHLRLSKDRFEQLLMYPQVFLRDGTRRLRMDGFTQIELFGYKLSELEDD